MAKWASAALLDGGLDYFIANCTRVLVIRNYTLGDSYATVNGGTNKIIDAAIASGDYSKSGAANAPRVLNLPAKSGVAAIASVGGDDLHFAYCSAGAVHYVTDETTNQVITQGNDVDVPALTYTSNQPV